MDEAVMREKLGQIMSEVRPMSAGPALPLREAARAPAEHPSVMRREMAALDDMLDHLRVAIKYMAFDLEATKRENRLLRDLLGDG